MPQAKEVISRSALLAMSTNYRSVSEAIMELVDNPFDYRANRHLVIDIVVDRDRDLLTVRDVGGEGMDDNALRDWLKWGEGHQHDVSDIGYFHVGGKLAAMFLANSIDITCRKANDATIWNFRDDTWGERTEMTELKITEEHVQPNSFAARLREDLGFVQIELSQLKRRRYDITALRNRLADTYRNLIYAEHCTIFVNGEKVNPVDTPWSSDISGEEIPPGTQVAPRVWIQGKIGALDRQELPKRQGVTVPAGVRLDYNGRKISDGETFGVNLTTRGTRRRLYGEISITGTGLIPSQNKTTWDHDSREWNQLNDTIRQIVEFVAKALEDMAGKRDTHSVDFNRAQRARTRISKLLDRLRSEGRRRNDSYQLIVSSLLEIDEIPDVALEGLGHNSPRSEWVESSDGHPLIVVNTDHPLRRAMNRSEPYMLETLLMHLCADSHPRITGQSVLRVLDELIWLDYDVKHPTQILPGTEPMSCLDAAYAVLRESGTAMHYSQITQRMLDAGIWQTDGATPAATVGALLAVDIKKPDSRFVRLGQGIYDLNGRG